MKKRKQQHSGLGVLLVILGLFFLIRELGWLPSIPLWPVVLIIIGVFLMLRRK